jgi:uncharacterized membrane protein YgcG
MSDNLTVADVDNWLKFQLICKPEQSGKTFIMIQEIIKNLTLPIHGKEIVNIILCDNNLLLTKQTSVRVEQDLKGHFSDGQAYVELSSHERTEYHDIGSVFTAIVANNVRNIICCTNGKRMDDIYQLIYLINTSAFTKGKFHFNIWVDEADKFIKFIDNTLRPIVDRHTNVNVKLITATPQPLFQKYEYINVFPIPNTTDSKYHGWEDNDIRIIEKECNNLDFAEHVLRIVVPNEVKPGTKWFIPGLSVKRSHEAIKNMCVAKGMAVICVNGNGIVITLPHTFEVFRYKKDDEFNNKIIELYNKHHLRRFPVVITGYICIGRGITINSSEFMLDYAILSHYSDKNEASQIAGRMKGNMKEFENYKKPVVFTTSNFNDIAIEWENKSRKLAELANQKEQNGMPTVIDKTEFKTCDKHYDYVCHPIWYDTFAQAKAFLVTKEREMDGKVRSTKGDVIHIRDGYSITSKLLKPGQTVEDLTKEDRITKEKAKSVPISRSISSTDKGSRYLILPVYENEESPPNSVKYQVRYIKFEERNITGGGSASGGGGGSASGGGGSASGGGI